MMPKIPKDMLFPNLNKKIKQYEMIRKMKMLEENKNSIDWDEDGGHGIWGDVPYDKPNIKELSTVKISLSNVNG